MTSLQGASSRQVSSAIAVGQQGDKVASTSEHENVNACSNSLSLVTLSSISCNKKQIYILLGRCCFQRHAMCEVPS